MLTLQGNAEEPSPETFEPVLFPGDSLAARRERNGGVASSLHVDLVEIEAIEELQRKVDDDAKQRAQEARRAEEALQAVILPPQQPAWTQPTLPPAATDLEPLSESVADPTSQPAAPPLPDPIPQADAAALTQPEAPLPLVPPPAADASFFAPVLPPPPPLDP